MNQEQYTTRPIIHHTSYIHTYIHTAEAPEPDPGIGMNIEIGIKVNTQPTAALVVVLACHTIVLVNLYVCMYDVRAYDVCMHIRMYVCMRACICMYVCICMHDAMHTHSSVIPGFICDICRSSFTSLLPIVLSALRLCLVVLE